MFSKRPKVFRLAMFNLLSALVGFGSVGTALAQPTTPVAPSDLKASPDVYKEIGGNDQYRMVEGVWKPGQRDNFHSHPRMMFYWATDCSMRRYSPDGTTPHDTDIKAGDHGIQDAIVSHSVENRGKSDCRIVMFEPRLPTP